MNIFIKYRLAVFQANAPSAKAFAILYLATHPNISSDEKYLSRDLFENTLALTIMSMIKAHTYLLPEVAKGAYFHGREVLFIMKYFSELTHL